MINIDEFKKIEIKIGEIKAVEIVPNTDKLLRLEVDIGEEEDRQIISGIAQYFPSIHELIGKKCAFATNLEPKTIHGLESNGMILAAEDESGNFSLLTSNKSIPAGTSVV